MKGKCRWPEANLETGVIFAGPATAAQLHVDGAVSKAVQLTQEALPSAAQLVDWIHRARDLGCKGVAIYCRPANFTAPRIDLRSGCPDVCRR